MQKDLQIFEHKDFGAVRVVEHEGLPWFVGKDVAKVLGYTNGSRDINRHVDPADMTTAMIPQYRDGTLVSKNILINESGLYSLIFSSKLPAAKVFTRWVTSEVLPSLRRHGAYITDDMLRRMAEDGQLAAEVIGRLQAEKERNHALLERLEETKPIITYYDTILQSPDAVQISIIAKDYGMSAVAMNKLLMGFKVQYKMGNTWLLYSQYADKGYTLTRTYHISESKTAIHTYWTQRGRRFIYDLLKYYGILPLTERCSCQLEEGGHGDFY